MEQILEEFNIPCKCFQIFYYDGQCLIEIFDKDLLNNYNFMMRLVENKIKIDVQLDPGTPIKFKWFPTGFNQYAKKWLYYFDYDANEKVNDLLLIFHQSAGYIINPLTDDEKNELFEITKTLVEFVIKIGKEYTTSLGWWEYIFVDHLIRFKATDALTYLKSLKDDLSKMNLGERGVWEYIDKDYDTIQ
jgi:hypothetical protein